MSDYFNYENAAEHAGLSVEQLEVLKQGIRRDFPHDDMLWELHVMRACNAIADKFATYEEVRDSLPPAADAA